VSDLTSHWRVFQGSYVSIEGKVKLTPLIGPSATLGIPEGMGLLVISDDKDMTVVVAGECFSPPLSEVKTKVRTNDQVIIKVVPLRLSMEFATSTELYEEYYTKIGAYKDYMPDSAMEGPTGDPVAVWGARWLSADDLTVLSD